MTEDKKPIEEEKIETPKKEILDKGKEEKVIDTSKKEENSEQEKPIEKSKAKPETSKKPIIKKKDKKPKVKKTEAIVDVKSLPISTKYAKEICRYIKNKKIEDAIKNLEDASAKRIAIPMRGEYGHKKGKRMAGGKYPKKASEQFIILLKSLAANSIVNGLDEPIIYEAIANLAPRQMAKFGRWQRKKTHVKIIAKEKKKSI